MTSDEIRQQLEAILAAGGIARFTYADSKGRISERRVAPSSVSETHCKGTDLDQHGYRSFLIERIQELDETPPIHPAGGYHTVTLDGPIADPNASDDRKVATVLRAALSALAKAAGHSKGRDGPSRALGSQLNATRRVLDRYAHLKPPQERNVIALAYLDPSGVPRAWARGSADKRDEVRRLAAAHLSTYLAEKRAAGDPLAVARFRLQEIDESGSPVACCAWCGRPRRYVDGLVQIATEFCECLHCHDCDEPHGPDGEGLTVHPTDATVARCDRCPAIQQGGSNG